jgi:hypothetical protein
VKFAKDVSSASRLVKKALASRRAKSDVAKLQALKPKRAKATFRVGVYFADGLVNMYQMRQWYEPLAELNKTLPVLVLARNPGGAKALMEETNLEVAYVPKIADIEDLLLEQPLSVVLYVNQNTRNFQMMRYGNRWHVFINHGESDKMYMTSNQYKTYDYAFVAGDAARKRLSNALWDYDVDARTFSIGRPQADHFTGAPPYPADDRITVLYSPTWEGDRPAAAYGSVASHGVTIAERVLASPRHRLVYRPHPRSGVVDEAFGHANQQIINMIADANQRDPQAGHVFDQSGSLGWQLSAPDVAICDISAMVYDRLAVGKPLLVTKPLSRYAELDEGGYLSVCEWLTADNSANILNEIDAVLHNAEAQQRLEQWSTFHFGDTTPGAPTKRFHDAVETLLTRADAWQSHSVHNVAP